MTKSTTVTTKRKWGWGGWRPGAGRKPKGDKAGVTHNQRPPLEGRYPIHIAWRLRKDLPDVTTPACLEQLALAFIGGSKPGAFKVVHWAFVRDELHLIVEAEDEAALSKGMCGLGVRVSRNLNRVLARRGKLFSDRYEARVLKSTAEVEKAHDGMMATDRPASTTPVIEPDTSLLRRIR